MSEKVTITRYQALGFVNRPMPPMPRAAAEIT